MSSSIKLYGSSDLPPNVCAELSDMINDSFFKKLDKHFDQQKEKTMAKEKHKLDYIKRWCEVIIERDNKREPEYNELLSEWIQGRYSMAKDILEVINGEK